MPTELPDYSHLPPPPIDPAADLRDFPFMQIDIERLFSSTFDARANDSEWRRGVSLWLKSFHQVPAGSLPDDDIVLCHLSGLGRDMKAWRKVKAVALWGWAKHSDGLLYHKTVTEKAVSAWNRKEAQRARSKKGNEKRWGRAEGLDGRDVEGDGPRGAGERENGQVGGKVDVRRRSSQGAGGRKDNERDHGRLHEGVLEAIQKAVQQAIPQAILEGSLNDPQAIPKGLLNRRKGEGEGEREGEGEKKEPTHTPVSTAAREENDQKRGKWDEPALDVGYMKPKQAPPKPQDEGASRLKQFKDDLLRTYNDCLGINVAGKLQLDMADIWLAQGYDPKIIIPIIRVNLNKMHEFKPLGYHVNQIVEAHRVRSTLVRPNEPQAKDYTDHVRMVAAGHLPWDDFTFGPPPGKPNCRIAPKDILAHYEKLVFYNFKIPPKEELIALVHGKPKKPVIEDQPPPLDEPKSQASNSK